MKKNNVGFVLAEAIVVSVFVLGMFTYLAMNVIPLISKYEKVSNYDNPQEIYLANLFYDELIDIQIVDINSKTTKLKGLANKQIEEIDGSGLVAQITIGENSYFLDLAAQLGIETIQLYNSNNDCDNIESVDKGLGDYCKYYIKRNDDVKNEKIYMMKFSGDTDLKNNPLNNKYASVVIKGIGEEYE